MGQDEKLEQVRKGGKERIVEKTVYCRMMVRGSDIRCRQDRFDCVGGGHNEMIREFLIRKFS